LEIRHYKTIEAAKFKEKSLKCPGAEKFMKFAAAQEKLIPRACIPFVDERISRAGSPVHPVKKAMMSSGAQ
jgi:hypothetical protein